MSPPMARRSLYRLRVVLVGMAAQAPVPRPAVPLPATRLRTSRFFVSTAVVLGPVDNQQVQMKAAESATNDENRSESLS